jgi:hypothetical protein
MIDHVTTDWIIPQGKGKTFTSQPPCLWNISPERTFRSVVMLTVVQMIRNMTSASNPMAAEKDVCIAAKTTPVATMNAPGGNVKAHQLIAKDSRADAEAL